MEYNKISEIKREARLEVDKDLVGMVVNVLVLLALANGLNLLLGKMFAANIFYASVKKSITLFANVTVFFFIYFRLTSQTKKGTIFNNFITKEKIELMLIATLGKIYCFLWGAIFLIPIIKELPELLKVYLLGTSAGQMPLSYDIFIWGSLFSVPFVIKIYSYSMAGFIRLDNSEVGVNEAITKSKEMTKGRRLWLFTVVMSFYGWYLLLGLLAISLYFLYKNNLMIYFVILLIVSAPLAVRTMVYYLTTRVKVYEYLREISRGK